MHYYPHNIGDYRKDTSHLTLLEHGIYRQLLDTYYLEEMPLCNDLAKLMRSHTVRNAEEQQALQNVLTDFFILTENGYIHNGCDKVLAKLYGKSESARASANARWSNKHKGKKRSQSKRNAVAMRKSCEIDANGMLPITHYPLPNINTNTLTPEGVSVDIFNDYMEVRKTKKAKWTATALKGLIRESGKAGISLEDAIRVCVERNWVSLKAEWLNEKKTTIEKNNEVISGLTRGILGGANNVRLLSK